MWADCWVTSYTVTVVWHDCVVIYSISFNWHVPAKKQTAIPLFSLNPSYLRKRDESQAAVWGKGQKRGLLSFWKCDKAFLEGLLCFCSNAEVNKGSSLQRSLQCLHTKVYTNPVPRLPGDCKCTFCQEKTTGFPCFWLKHCTLQDQIPGKQQEKKWVLTRRTVSKLLGFQDKAGIIPRLGCIIKPMLKLGISVSCGKQMGKIA